MNAEPFLTLPLRSCRDLLHVRHRARQIAQLLRFLPQEATCIAAGAFVVANQAKAALRKAEVCFAVVQRQFCVFARSKVAAAVMPENLYILHKPLPEDEQQVPVEDITWLIRQVEQLAPATLHDEIARQNQEVLALLAALRGVSSSSAPSQKPTAA